MSLILTTCHVYYSADDPSQSFSIEVPRVPVAGETVEDASGGVFYEVLKVKWVKMGGGGMNSARRWVPCLIARKMEELNSEASEKTA